MKCYFCNEEAVAPFRWDDGSMKQLCREHFRNLSNYAENRSRERWERTENEKWGKCPHCEFKDVILSDYSNENEETWHKERQECKRETCRYYKDRQCGWRSCRYGKNCRGKMKGAAEHWPLKKNPKVIFCSEECGKKYCIDKHLDEEERLKKQEEEFSQPCSQCGGSLSNTYFYDRTGNRSGKFCSQECFKKIYQDKLDKRQKLINGMKNREDISSYNWESADYLDEEDRKSCREYEKLRKQRENLGQQGQNHSNNQESNVTSRMENRENQNFTPASSSGSSNRDNSPNDNGNDSPPISNSPSSPSNNDNSPSTPQQEKPTPFIPPIIRFSDSNPTQDEKFSNCVKDLKEKKSEEVIFPTDISPKQKKFLEIIQDAIKTKHIDYDKLDLSEKEKDKLQDIIRSLGNISSSRSFGNRTPSNNNHSNKTFGLLIIGGLLVVIVLAAIVMFRKRKRKKLSKKKV